MQQLDHLVGRQVGDFLIEERIGRGGMSVVYRAHQHSVNRDVALKVIVLNPDQDEFRRRFAQEAKLVATLEHIHILPIYDYGIIEGDIAYLAMRLLRGGSLSQLLAEGPLTLDQTADIFTQIGRGLSYAHRRNVIHRDLKPSNIMLDDAGNAYLTDFGLAKLVGDNVDMTKSGNIVGTPAYMSPEQLRGESVDGRSDIYSLGVVLYHMLTGQAPFESSESNVISVIYQHLEKQPRLPSDLNPTIPSGAEVVVLRALAKEPGDRYQSVDEMVRDLNESLDRRTSSTSSFPIIKPGGSATTFQRTAAPAPVVNQKSSSKMVLGFVMGGLVLVLLVSIGLALSASRGLTTGTPTPEIFPTPQVLVGERGVSAEGIPSAAEIERAQAHMGPDGFIAYIACNQSSEYHATQAREMGDFARAYGLSYRVYDSENDKGRQIPLIERARTEGASSLIICPLDVPLLANTLASAQAANIPMVFLHSDMESYGGVLLAGDDYLMGYNAGKLAGELITAERGGEARVLILDYPLPAIENRVRGIEDALAEFAPEAEIIGTAMGAITEEAKNSVGALLAEGTEFDVIVSINDAGSFGAVQALEAAEIPPEDVIITSVDAEVLALEYIRDDYYIRGSVDVGREQFSRTAIDTTVKLLAGATLPETFLVPPGDALTRSELEARATATAAATEES